MRFVFNLSVTLYLGLALLVNGTACNRALLLVVLCPPLSLSRGHTAYYNMSRCYIAPCLDKDISALRIQ